MKRILIITLHIILLSCSNNKKSIQEQTIYHNAISDEIFIGRGGNMIFLSDSILLVLTITEQTFSFALTAIFLQYAILATKDKDRMILLPRFQFNASTQTQLLVLTHY